MSLEKHYYIERVFNDNKETDPSSVLSVWGNEIESVPKKGMKKGTLDIHVNYFTEDMDKGELYLKEIVCQKTNLEFKSIFDSATNAKLYSKYYTAMPTSWYVTDYNNNITIYEKDKEYLLKIYMSNCELLLVDKDIINEFLWEKVNK